MSYLTYGLFFMAFFNFGLGYSWLYVGSMYGLFHIIIAVPMLVAFLYFGYDDRRKKK